MGLFPDDGLKALLTRELTRICDHVMRFAAGERGALLEARNALQALIDVEARVLAPAYARVSLRPEAQRLLEDACGERALQLAALESLSRRRALRLRKLGAVELCAVLRQHANQHGALLLSALSSQLPRPMYHSIASAFTDALTGRRRGTAHGSSGRAAVA